MVPFIFFTGPFLVWTGAQKEYWFMVKDTPVLPFSWISFIVGFFILAVTIILVLKKWNHVRNGLIANQQRRMLMFYRHSLDELGEKLSKGNIASDQIRRVLYAARDVLTSEIDVSLEELNGIVHEDGTYTTLVAYGFSIYVDIIEDIPTYTKRLYAKYNDAPSVYVNIWTVNM